MTSDAFDAAAEQPRLELVVSSALYLMSAYGRNGGCPQMAAMIVRHLDAIAERDDAPAVLRSSCANLVDQWECLRQQAQQRPATPARAQAGAGLPARLRALLH